MASDKFIDDLLGPLEPEPAEEPQIGQADEKAGSETGPPDIEPMRDDPNEEMPPAATAEDKVDIVEPIQQELPNTQKEPEPATVDDASHGAPEDTAPVPTEEVKPSPEDGLRKEIVRLRAELKKGEVLGAPTQTPTLPPAPVGPPPTGAGGAPPPSIPGAQVVVSEDGTQVYLPDEEINRRVAAQVQQAMQPTPMQQVAMANNQSDQEFIAADPARNQPAMELFKNVDEFLGLKLADLQAKGYKPQSVPELTHTLKVMGVEQEFATYFPAVQPMFDEIIAATASQQPAWRRSVLDRMAGGMVPPPAEGEPSVPLVDVAGLPQALAKKGGTRSQAATGDTAEFKALETGFHKDPVGFPKEKYTRYQELGRALKEEGFDSI